MKYFLSSWCRNFCLLNLHNWHFFAHSIYPYFPSNRNSQYNQPQQIADGSCNQELQSPGGLSSPQNSWGSVPSLNNGQNHQTGVVDNDANSINYGQPPPAPLQSQSQQQV